MSLSLDTSTVGPGFGNVVLQSQASFEALMRALSRPGEIVRLDTAIEAPAGLSHAASVILLTLADLDAPVWLPKPLREGPAGAYIRFHCGARLVAETRDAAFAVITEPLRGPSIAQFDEGDDRYPDRAATVIIEVPTLDGGEAVRLRGPGIPETRNVAPGGLNAGFWEQWRANHAAFPLGVDAFLVSGEAVMGLPRSVDVTRI